MKKIFVIASTLILFICFTILINAESSSNAPSRTPPHPSLLEKMKKEGIKEPRPAAMTMTGFVESIDKEKNKVVIKNDGMATYMRTFNATPAVISSMQIGDHIKVEYEPQGNIIQKIEKVETAPVETLLSIAGDIMSVDIEKNKFVLKKEKEITFEVDPKNMMALRMLKKIEVGENITVMFKEGSSKAECIIRKIIPRKNIVPQKIEKTEEK